MPTRQDAAVTAANAVISMMAQFKTLRAAINDFVTQYNSEGYSNIWDAMATAAQNTDGSLGAADGAPNNAHPIDTRVITSLQKSVTAMQLVNAVQTIEDFQKFIGNQAVATANRNQNIDDLAS